MNLESVQPLSQSPHKQLQSQSSNDGDLPVNIPNPLILLLALRRLNKSGA